MESFVLLLIQFDVIDVTNERDKRFRIEIEYGCD